MTDLAVVVVCDRCGQRSVGIIHRRSRYFEYEPEAVPQFTRHKTLRQRWSPDRAGSTDRQDVFCERCGWLSFAVGEAVGAARQVPPGGKPVPIRATPPHGGSMTPAK